MNHEIADSIVRRLEQEMSDNGWTCADIRPREFHGAMVREWKRPLEGGGLVAFEADMYAKDGSDDGFGRSFDYRGKATTKPVESMLIGPYRNPRSDLGPTFCVYIGGNQTDGYCQLGSMGPATASIAASAKALCKSAIDQEERIRELCKEPPP